MSYFFRLSIGNDKCFFLFLSLLCLHGGLIYASESARSSRESSCDRNTSLPEETRDRCTNYRMGMFNNVDYVDVPHDVEGEEFYRATIGHKVKINETKFCSIYLILQVLEIADVNRNIP
jgi:hypothetical protein